MAERYKLSSRVIERSFAIVAKGPLTDSGCDEVVLIVPMRKTALEILRVVVPKRERRNYRVERVRVCDVQRR